MCRLEHANTHVWSLLNADANERMYRGAYDNLQDACRDGWTLLSDPVPADLTHLALQICELFDMSFVNHTAPPLPQHNCCNKSLNQQLQQTIIIMQCII